MLGSIVKVMREAKGIKEVLFPSPAFPRPSQYLAAAALATPAIALEERRGAAARAGASVGVGGVGGGGGGGLGDGFLCPWLTVVAVVWKIHSGRHELGISKRGMRQRKAKGYRMKKRGFFRKVG